MSKSDANSQHQNPPHAPDPKAGATDPSIMENILAAAAAANAGVGGGGGPPPPGNKHQNHPHNPCIRFLDLSEGEQRARASLVSQQTQLLTQKAAGSNDPNITPQLMKIAVQLSGYSPLDPLFLQTALTLQRTIGGMIVEEIAD